MISAGWVRSASRLAKDTTRAVVVMYVPCLVSGYILSHGSRSPLLHCIPGARVCFRARARCCPLVWVS